MGTQMISEVLTVSEWWVSMESVGPGQQYRKSLAQDTKWHPGGLAIHPVETCGAGIL